jgi:hypothetical protein
MAEGKAPWPTGDRDGTGPNPWIFSPKGFLVAILVDSAGAERARDRLVGHGFAEDDLRLYTSEEILDIHAAHLANRGPVRRFVRAATTEPEIPLYYDYARDGRSALWLRVVERADASRAMAYLADDDVLHFHYYGNDGEEDIHIR